MHIVPIHPKQLERQASSEQGRSETPVRRTLGKRSPSRRTLGRRGPGG